MKTADITRNTTYAFQEKPSFYSTNPALVLENLLWTEKDLWYTDGDVRKKRRVLCRAEKGTRAGGRDWIRHDYKKSGIPILKLNLTDWHFAEYAFTETAHELLVQAADKLNLLDLVDSEESVFDTDGEGRTYRRTRTTVVAHFADGSGTKEIQVDLDLVRPQSIIEPWEEYLESYRKAAVAKAEQEKQSSEAKAKNTKIARNIRDRVTALLDDADAQRRYNAWNERYDVHRKYTSSGISSTYEVSEATLLKLLELAEKGAGQ